MHTLPWEMEELITDIYYYSMQLMETFKFVVNSSYQVQKDGWLKYEVDELNS